MAITLSQKISYDLSGIVAAAIASARQERAKKLAKTEADFQKAVADGEMDYDTQIKFREKQLEEELGSSLKDDEAITSLKTSIGSIKRLNRFNKYRLKYASNFADMKAGKINAEQHLEFLKEQTNFTTDSELQLEIQNEIVTAENEVKQYHNTILSNQVKLAQNDGTIPMLNDAITKVQNKRALASLNGNEDEVLAYDNTLLDLRSRINKTKIEDSLNDLEVKGISKGLGAFDKVDALNKEIANSDINSPITINNKKYSSAQAYWTQLRDGYLAGNGTGIFGNFFNELKSAYSDKINAAVSRDGFAATFVLDNLKNDFETIKQKPEYQPYLNQVNDLQSIVLGEAFKSTAKMVIDRADFTGQFKEAESALKSYQQRYGIETESYQLNLGQKLVSQVASVSAATGKSPEEVAKESGVSEVAKPESFPIPEVKPSVPVVPEKKVEPVAGGQTEEQRQAAFKAANVPPPEPALIKTTPKFIEVKPGETLSAIAERELGDANKWKQLKTESGQTFNETTAKNLQVGTKLILPQ